MIKILATTPPSNNQAAIVGQQVAVLAAADIRSRARASTQVDGGVTLRVQEDDLAYASDLLADNGLLG